ncbi:ABC transporter ATP-binding protein [Ochrobactrum sp. MYb379]|uniref:ABC transporter ATP-binding protein n=1 Tax=Ochrobactrum sp. MYb379 TaxID=2745275 RepID=UPI0030B145C4
MGKLSLKNIVKSFGQFDVVKNVSLEVNEGEFMVFVGPSGCGKSTLLRMIAGLEDTTSGDIIIDEKRVNDLPPVKRGIAMVFQSYALYPHMSVYENIAFPLRVEGADNATIKREVEHAASILHLDQRLEQKPGMLSGGQRQRVAIGRAIVREPKIFLFDEPLSNLDAALRADMRIELTKLHKQLGATMIYVTHDQVEAMTMADRIVVLEGGNISQVGTPLELYNKPRNSFVAGFIGNPRMNMLPVTFAGFESNGYARVKLGSNELVLPVLCEEAARPDVGQTLTLGIRPEHVAIGEGAVAITVQPSVVERLGQQTIVYSTPEGMSETFCIITPGTAPISGDASIKASFDAQSCHLFDQNGIAFTRQGDFSN